MRNPTFLLPALLLAACSHAEMSATTPAPKANYIASTNIDSEAVAESDRFCRYYHAEPPVLVRRAGTLWRFECAGTRPAGELFFVERLLDL